MNTNKERTHEIDSKVTDLLMNYYFTEDWFIQVQIRESEPNELKKHKVKFIGFGKYKIDYTLLN